MSDVPLSLFSFCVGILLYAPLLVLYLGHSAGNFTMAALVWPAVICAGALAVPAALARRWPKGVGMVDTLLLAPAIYVLLAVTFYPVSGGVLDGTERTVGAWERLSHVGLMGLCAAVSVAALASPTIRAAAKRAGDLLGLFAAAASAFMAVSILPLHNVRQDAARYAAGLGTRQNVIVVLLDMLEGNFAADYFRRNPSAERDFDGFVFHRNTVSFAPFTALSYAGFMSGGYPSGDQVKAGSIRDTIYYRGNIIDDMASAGFATRFFSVITYENDNRNVVRVPDDIGIDRKSNFLYFALAVRGRYVPYSYLPLVETYMPWMQREWGWLSKVDARDSFRWFVDNVAVDPSIDRGFFWFHTLMTHQPIRFEPSGRFSMALRPDDAGGEVSYAFDLLRQLSARLKQVGAYDDSLVIFVSDHGYNILTGMKAMPRGAEYSLARFGVGIEVGQYNPLLMVKPPRAHGRMTYDDEAISLLDLRKSLKEFATPGSAAAMDGFDFLNGKGSRERAVPVIRFTGSSFANKDFLELANWTRDTLRLPLDENYAPPAGQPVTSQ